MELEATADHIGKVDCLEGCHEIDVEVGVLLVSCYFGLDGGYLLLGLLLGFDLFELGDCIL